ncbi:uncharacterized protein A1O9_00620 [Exophiala aquamarina CBS 119918]|uniref:Murein transglycosylase n=1 Tax=Exophiala aquamarina CBS 119918 TaxID=1182545 RepID=A0A072PSA5_9EURO|nr:uncharacterized protein A1O9_00620 [Exophiala aquamarina CBS 119918]KEF62647.1 hypothetical protein A1O9_00620 [Exophiala aquamarina CBS 119918]
MKALCLGLLAVSAQVGLAVPHGRFNAFIRRSDTNSPFQDHHQHRHPVRAVTTNTVVDVVTVTASNAVVWVDQNGVILSTEYHDKPPATSAATVPPTVTHTAPVQSGAPSSAPPSASSQPASSSQAANRQSSTAQGNARPSDQQTSPSYTPPFSTNYPSSNAPTSSAAPASNSPAGSAAPSSGGQNKVPADMSGLGICYELIDNAVQCRSKDTMNSDFALLKSQGFTKVRVYDIGCPLGDVAAAAGAQGLALIAGINTVSSVASDIAKLISMLQGNWGVVDTIVVGNEVVNTNSGAVGSVVAAIATARALLSAAGFSGHVVTVDTFIAHSNHPELCANSDYCAVNAHAFFDVNTLAEQAGDFVLNTAIGMVQKVANGKTIVVTESGWPHQGSPNGKAVPSVPNQQAAIGSLKSKVAGSGIGLFLFQAYDATYKQPGALGVEQFFGIYGH